ncbi:MmcQ/YjbR family DNA-binding protein [Oryzihumus sp.]
MVTKEDVRRVALALPGATEEAGFTFRVAGKQFVWLWRERVDPRKPKVPNPGVVVVRVADLGEKQALLASDPATFFTTDHYDGYRAVLVRLDAVDGQVLAEVVTDSWRTQAPKHLLSEVDGG